MGVLIPLYIQDVLHRDPSVYSSVLLLQGILAIALSMALARMSGPRRIGVAFYVCLILTDAALVAGAVVGVLPVSIALFAMVGAATSALDMLWRVVVQANVPVEMQGRIGSVDFLVSMLLSPLSLALLPTALSSVGVRSILVAAGVVAGAAAAAAVASRSIRALSVAASEPSDLVT